MNLVLAASTTIPLKDVLPHIWGAVSPLPEGSWVHLRKPTKKPASPFELAVAGIAAQCDVNVRWWMPGPGGRQATFARDVQMVEAADEVLVFFTEGEEMHPQRGTGHVVEKALDQGKRCRAYSVVDGELKWVGGHDPEDSA